MLPAMPMINRIPVFLLRCTSPLLAQGIPAVRRKPYTIFAQLRKGGMFNIGPKRTSAIITPMDQDPLFWC